MDRETASTLDKIEVFSLNSAKGRGLRALSAIPAGTSVLEEDPFVYILNEEQLQIRCEYCLRAFTTDRISEISLRACNTCKKAFYCSRTCQCLGFEEHRYECKLLRGRIKDNKEITLRLLTKIIRKNRESISKTSAQASNGFPSSLNDLCSSKMSAGTQEYILGLFRQYEKEWRGKFRTRVTPLRGREILDVYQKLAANSFLLYDEMKRVVIGEALYLRASLFNHSCEPNCTFVCDGARLNVRAIRRIEAGEECCISYVSSLLPTRLRQEKLTSVYGFSCRCPRCMDSSKDNLMLCVRCPTESCREPVLPLQDGLFQMCHTCHAIISSLEHSTAVERLEAFSEEVLQEVKRAQQETEDINSYQSDSRLVVILRQCLRQQTSLLHPSHHCVLRASLEAMQTFSRLARWKDALSVSQGILEMLRQHLSPEDPFLGFFLLKLSIVHSNLGNHSTTVHLLQQAIPLLEVAYGEHHHVTNYAKELHAKSS